LTMRKSSTSTKKKSVPADGLFVQIDINLFCFEIFFNSPVSQFASEAGLLISAPWSFHISGLHMIHPYDARAQLLYCADRFVDIARPNGSGQSEFGIIGNSHRLRFIFKRN